MEAVHKHLTSYCVHVCATSVLQDAESHYWADDKAFYEVHVAQVLLVHVIRLLCKKRVDKRGVFKKKRFIYSDLFNYKGKII